MKIKTLALALGLSLPSMAAIASPEVLMVLTNQDSLGPGGEATGYWLEELAVPYLYLNGKGSDITLASIDGGKAPVDPRSLDNVAPELSNFLKTHQVELSSTTAISELTDKHYDAVILVGGHGTMWDFRQSKTLASLVSEQWQQGATIAAVCHGVSGLLEASINGKKLIENKRLTGFSNSEEAILKLTQVVPYALETALVNTGANYTQGANYTPYIVEDGRLITGQNPMSSKPMVEALWQQIKE